MTWTVKRLGPGDEAILALLSTDGADFDFEGRGEAETPLSPARAARFLANPAACQWVALDGDHVVGELYCLTVPMAGGDEDELLLYSIGVRSAYRRRGVGRALMAEMDRWMVANELTVVWVLADNPTASAFYQACGFAVGEEQPVYLTRGD